MLGWYVRDYLSADIHQAHSPFKNGNVDSHSILGFVLRSERSDSRDM